MRVKWVGGGGRQGECETVGGSRHSDGAEGLVAHVVVETVQGLAGTKTLQFCPRDRRAGLIFAGRDVLNALRHQSDGGFQESG